MPEDEADLNETIGHVLNLVIRRRWWILLPACTISLGTIGVLLHLPNRYSSEATLVMQQQVSQRYVLPATTMTNAEAVLAVTREVLSRSKLLDVINQFDLYADRRKSGATPDELAELMRHDIAIQPLDPNLPRSDFYAFKVSFTAGKPQVAQLVTRRLTQLFIDESLKTRGNQATRTTNFLSDQLQAANEKLALQEQRLRDFKTRHLGELPEQQATNIQALSDLRLRLQGTMSSLSRVQQQRAPLDSSLNGILGRLQSERATLLTRYTPRHRAVLKKDEEIAKTEAVLKHLRTGTPGMEKPESLQAAGDLILAELVRQVESNGHDIEELSKEEAQLRTEIARYQNRLNLTPVREQELAAVVRDYDVLKQQYTDLLGKQHQSELATTLEERGEGLEFRLVDPPTLPMKPSSPKRVKNSFLGAVAGVFLGLALAFLVNTRDRCFHSEKSLSERFALPLVVGVPMLLTPAEEGIRSWKRAFEWAAGCVMALAVFAAEFYVYRHG